MNNGKLPVLFIAMEFAPVNTTGNFRSLKFVKYLREFDVEPIVLTFDVANGSKAFSAKVDNQLLKEVPKNTDIYRLPLKPIKPFFSKGMGSFLRIFFSIDEGLAKRWVTSSFWKRLDTIIQKHQPKVVYVSLPPFSAGSLGIKVSKRYNLPLVVDMRDHWSQWSNTPFASKIHYNLTVQRERKILKQASKILGVTDELNKDFQRVHPSIPKEKFVTIFNGYDVDFAENNQQVFTSTITQKKVFKIGYIGSFYFSPEAQKQMNQKWWQRSGHKKFAYSPRREDWLYRSPYFFLKSLHLLLKKRPEWKSRIRFEHIGRKPAWLDGMLKEFDLENNFHAHGFIPYQQVLKVQQSFDALLATSEKVINGEHYCLPSKVFDYLRTQKPIIAFLTKGAQKTFFDEIEAAIFCDPDDLPQAVHQLEKVINGEFSLSIRYDKLQKYHRRNMTSKLAQTIKNIGA